MNVFSVPDPNTVHPVPGYDAEVYVRPTLTNPNISVGEFTYIADREFESHVTHFYPWSRDRLITEIRCLIPLLTNADLPFVKKELKKLI